jgi:carboxymethylenebutenolidase
LFADLDIHEVLPSGFPLHRGVKMMPSYHRNNALVTGVSASGMDARRFERPRKLITGGHMDQRIINLYDSFTHGDISRRVFLDRLVALTGSTAAAAALLPLLKNDYAQAAIAAENDTRLAIDRVSYDSPKGKINGYLVRPKAKGKRPVTIVIHENRGLNPHVQDVARRLAIEGFLAFAPDLLSVSGGTPPDEDQARDLHTKTDPKDMTAAAAAAVPFMISYAESNGNVGVVGFCFGGGIANRLAVERPDLKAAVAYYGIQPPAEQVPAIRAPLLLHYAGLDDRVNAGIAAYEAALKANGKRYTIYMYPGVNHAFNNDTGGSRYNKEAADLAWQRTLTFFKEQLGTPPRAA